MDPVGHFREDGLLPPVDEQEYEWLRPADGFGDDNAEKVQRLAGWLTDIIGNNRIVWPAEVGGELVPPPAAHALDYLVRRQFADTDNVKVSAEFQLRPIAGTVGVLDELPPCFFCETAGRPGVAARYDAPAGDGDGAWAYMCPRHYRAHSTGRLGNGLGQYLMLDSEVPAEVIDARERAGEYWTARMSDTAD